MKPRIYCVFICSVFDEVDVAADQYCLLHFLTEYLALDLHYQCAVLSIFSRLNGICHFCILVSPYAFFFTDRVMWHCIMRSKIYVVRKFYSATECREIVFCL